MSDQIQRDDAEWQLLLDNQKSMVKTLLGRIESLQRTQITAELREQLASWVIVLEQTIENENRLYWYELKHLIPHLRSVIAATGEQE